MLQYIYITIGWIPGSVLFLKRHRKIIDTSVTTPIDMAEQLMTETVEKAITKFSIPNPKQFRSELYYEIYDRLDEDAVPFLYSSNSPAASKG